VLNNLKDSWRFRFNQEFQFPEIGRSVIILVEHDVVYDDAIEVPFTRIASLEQHYVNENSCENCCGVYVDAPYDWCCGKPKRNTKTISSWKLLDYIPEEEEEYLQQYYTVIAWRYLLDV
jgi:hypothetical protein